MRKRSMNRILDARDTAARRLHATNRGFSKKFKRLLFKSGLAKFYFKSTERFTKVFESVGFVFGYIWHLFLSSTVHSSTAESIRRAGDKTKKKVNRSWEDIASNIADQAEKSIFTSWLVKTLRVLRKIFQAIFGFWIDWLWTRNFWLLLGAIPATLLTLPVAYFLFRIPFMSAAGISKSYQKAVQRAIDANDFDAAALYNRRIAQLGNRPLDQMAFSSAMKLAEKGKLEEASKQVQRLASPDKTGFAPAHVWLALHLRAGDIRSEDQTDDEVNELIKRHLEHALKLSPEHPTAIQLLAATYLATDEKKLAKETLDKNKHLFKEPLIRVRVAGLYQMLGDQETAVELHRSADEQSRTREQFENDLPPVHYIGRAEIELSRGQLPAAIKALEVGLEKHPDDKTLAEYLASLLVMRYDTVATLYAPEERFSQLTAALDLHPTNIDVLRRISRLAEHKTMVADVTTTLEAALNVEEVDLAEIHSLLGSAYAVSGDLDKSQTAYESVLEHTKTDAEAYNNLAWLYSQRPPLQLELALNYSQRAVAMSPSNPHFRDTLGHVYIKSEKWENAIEELRQALNGMPDNKKTHRAIALCYTKLGNTELARKHANFSAP